jgi:hypothetical protein
MAPDYRQKLAISPDRLEAINAVLLDPDSRVIEDFLAVVSKYGTPEEINQKAAEASQMEVLLKRVEAINPEYVEDLIWLEEQRDQQAFITINDYRRKVLGEKDIGCKTGDRK